MSIRTKVIEETRKAVKDGYEPPARPACAYFVSEMLHRAGWDGQLTGWVPTLVDMGRYLEYGEELKPGDLVIFKETYDAVSPGGIGPEDTLTHVGILLGKNNKGNWEFAHYSASLDKPVVAELAGYWEDHVENYIILLSENNGTSSEIEEKNTDQLKIFWHPDSFRPKVIWQEEEHMIRNFSLEMNTMDGHKIRVQSHPFETTPVVSVDNQDFPIRYIGTRGFEYEVFNHEDKKFYQ